MKTLSLFDTSICSTNLGDRIIMDAVKQTLDELFSDALIVHFPTHDFINLPSYKIVSKSKLVLVGGSNLLSSNMPFYRQWKVGLLDFLNLSDVILMGVGWWQYQNQPNPYTKLFYRKVLSENCLHSVRDSYTQKQLNSIGIKNVINTSCPTTWSLTHDHCQGIPQQKADSVLLTFTVYKQNEEMDSKLVEVLLKEYKNVFFWTQQPNDYKYMKKMTGEKIHYVEPTLDGLDDALQSQDVDYVGTRLHAGIRALQHKKRSIILGVDNRATEISKDINLPVIDRADISGIVDLINSNLQIKINLPEENIKLWKESIVSYWKSR